MGDVSDWTMSFGGVRKGSSGNHIWENFAANRDHTRYLLLLPIKEQP